MIGTDIKWDERTRRVSGSPTATLSVARSVWERAGARFFPADDRDGETPWLATAVLPAPGEALLVGVLSYDDECTYLLVPGEGNERRANTRAVLDFFAAQGLVDIDRDVLGVVGDDDEAASRGQVARLRSRARRSGYALTLLVAALFIYLSVRDVRFDEAWRAMRASNDWWLIPAFGAFVLATFMRVLRWRSLFAPGRRPPVGAVGAATLIGYLFNNIMPARAGEAARVVALTQRAGTPPAEIVGTVVVERAYDILSILIIFFCAAPWLPPVGWFGTAAAFAGVMAVLLGGAIWVLAVHGDRPLRFVLRPLSRLPKLSAERVERAGVELAAGLSGLRDRRVAIEALVWSIGIWLMSALWAWLVLLAFQPSLGFDAGVLVIVAIGLAMIIPAPPAAVGVFEAAGVLALKAFGISQTDALPYAIVLHVVNFVPFIVAGVLTLQLASRRPRRLAEAATYT